jgi:hypothetical protein
MTRDEFIANGPLNVIGTAQSIILDLFIGENLLNNMASPDVPMLISRLLIVYSLYIYMIGTDFIGNQSIYFYTKVLYLTLHILKSR